MDKETIVSLICNLSKRDFDAVVSLVLERVFNFKAINVDRPGDGGSDWLTFRDSTGATTMAHQVTIQEKKWQDKALNDATKAVNELAA